MGHTGQLSASRRGITATLFTTLGLLVSLGTVFCRAGDQFEDDFNRSNTDVPNGGIGEDWEIVGNVFLNDKHAITHTQEQGVAIVKNVALSKGFKAEIDFYGQVNDNSGGVVFNYASPGNFDVLRFGFSSAGTSKAWQFLRFVDGKPSILAQGMATPEVSPTNEWRRLKVYSLGGSGEYAFEISDKSGQDVFLSATFRDPDGNPPGGKAGFFFGGAYMFADNFSLLTGQESFK